jgi:hypothetical protein
MNKKQQLATGFLALVIVGSVALMPVSARTPTVTASQPATLLASAPSNSQELAQDQVRDLTYN